MLQRLLVVERVRRDGVPADWAEVHVGRKWLSAVRAGDDGRRLARRASAMRAKVRAAEDRSPALTLARAEAARGDLGRREKGIKLVDPVLDPEDFGAARGEQVVAPVVAAGHLERETADVSDLDLA